MTWQAGAAWVGAVLGVINFALTFLAKRPIISLASRSSVGIPEMVLKISNMGDTPLLVRRMRIWSKGEEIVPNDEEEIEGDRIGIHRTVLFMESGRFLKFIPPGQSAEFQLIGLERGRSCWLLLKWTQQRVAFPWSVRYFSKRLTHDLVDAIDPNAALANRRG